MGNDGGSIPTRRELVKEAARNPTTAELKESQQEQQEYYWTTDPLSRQPLARPIVSDCNGKLYNKDSIIQHVLSSDGETNKAEAESILLGAVKSIKDVVDVKFEVVSDDSSNGTAKSERFVCPITKDTLGPGMKSVYLVPCGHAFSAAAIKEISEEKCAVCAEPYAPNDIIPILPTTTTDVARLSLRIKTLQEKGLTHSLKKATGDKKKDKKRKKHAEAGQNEISAISEGASNSDLKRGTPPQTNGVVQSGAGIKNTATANLTAKVMKEQEERNKRRKTDKNDPLGRLYTSKEHSNPHGKNSDFMTRGFSIPANGKK